MDVFAIYATGVLSLLTTVAVFSGIMTWHIARLGRALRRKLRVK